MSWHYCIALLLSFEVYIPFFVGKNRLRFLESLAKYLNIRDTLVSKIPLDN